MVRNSLSIVNNKYNQKGEVKFPFFNVLNYCGESLLMILCKRGKDMKIKIKKIVNLLIVVTLLFACNINTCESDNEGLCEIEKIESFEVEEEAKIVVGVFNESFGEDLVQSFNQENPNNKDLLSYKVIKANDKEMIEENLNQLDIIEMQREDVPLYLDKIKPFDETFNSLLENESLSKFSKEINQKGNYFIPFEYEGLLFAYNKTMLESFNVDLLDENNDGLADSIDSFEKIVELANTWRKNDEKYLDESIENIFSFPLNEQLAMLTFFENSDYRLINGSNAEQMQLNEKLLRSFETLSLLGEKSWKFDNSLENDLKWNYEEVLEKQNAPFLLVGNWMYYDYFQTSKAYELVFSKVPSFNDKSFSPITSVSGFVLSDKNKYPNAANKVIKHIKGLEGIQTAVNNNIIPIINEELIKINDFNIDDNTQQQIKAYQYSRPSSLQAFKQKPEKRGWDIYLENDFREIFKNVFIQEISPKEAQQQFVEKIKQWLDSENIEVEGVNNDNVEEDN